MNSKEIKKIIISAVVTIILTVISSSIIEALAVLQKSANGLILPLIKTSVFIGLFITIYVAYCLVENHKKRSSRKRNWLGLIIGPLFCVLPFIAINIFTCEPEPFMDTQFGILIAKFDDPQQNKNNETLQKSIVSQLQQNYSKDIDTDNISIVEWPGTFKEENGKLAKIGKKQNADIIIYGEIFTIQNLSHLVFRLAIENQYLKPEVKENNIRIDKKYSVLTLPLEVTDYLNVLYDLSLMFINLNKSDFSAAKLLVENLTSEIGAKMKHHFLGIIYYNQAFKDHAICRNSAKRDSLLVLAKSEYLLSVQLDSTYHNSYFALGQFFSPQGPGIANFLQDYDSAAVYFEKAYRLKPKNQEYIITLSRAYLDAKWFQDVISLTNSVKNTDTFKALLKEYRDELEQNLKIAEDALKTY